MFIAALFTTAKIQKQPKCPINRWMNKEDVVDTHNGISLGHKKQWHLAIHNNMDGPSGYYAKENGPAREDK